MQTRVGLQIFFFILLVEKLFLVFVKNKHDYG